ncbi:MAG: hypothetical protein COV67_01985 [Nitrospinae bacterium CG11_big_fil_rev_8_21_14_0_20_56_8]|nr:MAG: hypothetical protein COV67_01985 [Nitrospinae bacterium CG11_big_fil_rev_8_21_14_0_20_56_8]
MPLPDFIKSLVEKKVGEYCDHKIPAHLRDKITVTYEIRGNSVTLFENRAPWREEMTEWTKSKVAQMRYDEKKATWNLFCRDRNGKWHPYGSLSPTKNLDRVLEEINDDPTCIFWG